MNTEGLTLPNIDDLKSWDAKTLSEQRRVRQLIINQCVGRLYPSLLYSEIFKIEDEMRALKDEKTLF